MKRLLSTALAVILLLGLAALAMLARPNGADSVAPARADSGVITQTNSPAVVQPSGLKVKAPMSPQAAANYNVIGMPLNASAQFAAAGFTYDADGLAKLVGASVLSVMRWNTQAQVFDSWDPVNGEGWVGGSYTTTPFALAVGGAYWLMIDNTGPTVLSFVGDVPAAGSVKFTLKGAAGTCSYNEITVPLDQAALSDANLLAANISATEVASVLRWNATAQVFDSWDPINGEGWVGGSYTTTPFDIKIGYPYLVCLTVGVNGQIWPQ